MIDRTKLLSDLQRLLKTLETDLLERSDSADVPDMGRTLREEFAAAQAAERTAQNFEDWRSDAITQAAAAWVLSCVFVRFLEDNQLVPTPKIAGPGEGLKRARDEHELYFRSHPTLTDRDYLLAVFDGLTKHSATKEVFGEHNPIRDLPNWLSGDAAGALITFFQRIDPNTGVLVHDFTDPDWDTRFLGDLYQDLSEEARKKYALLQTPVFVEEFILDRTLDPAIEEFGLAKPGYETRVDSKTGRLDPADRFKMIDPACGSGHFLLGSFARLVDYWRKKDPGAKVSVLVQRALDGVHGVDANPYAIVIARFRLLLAALKECGIKRLSDAPGFEIHLACGDSLLHGSVRKVQQMFDVADELKHVYQPEDPEALSRLLKPGSYHAVVANPPYITPKDSSLSAAYRERYSTCHRQYSLAVPFLERIVSLAIDGGFTGQITANSFMKREFGKKLIEEFFPRVDLTHVIDTSLAHIPGHGTPTVILFVRNHKPVTRQIRAVMSIKREDKQPDDPARGLVWSSILDQVDRSGSRSDFVSVADSPRELFHKHPWSIGGGGAAELKEQLEASAEKPLGAIIHDVGRTTHTGEDDAFYLPSSACNTYGYRSFCVPLITGEDVRDYVLKNELLTLFPYDRSTGEPTDITSASLSRHFWTVRTTLRNRRDYGESIEQRGLRWFDHSMFFARRYRSRHSIAFGFVATQNHFVFDRGGKVFNRHAPVIILSPEATEEDHLALLGLLSCSSACFWMKQVFFDRGGGGIGGGIAAEGWERFYVQHGTKLKLFPLLAESPLKIASRLDELAQHLSSHAPGGSLQRWESRGIMSGTSIRDSFEVCRREWITIREQMIALQEELDWECYRLYGLTNEDLTHRKDVGQPPPAVTTAVMPLNIGPGEGTAGGGYPTKTSDIPGLMLGQRAFEIVLARKLTAGEAHTTWFERHGSTPITEIPAEWPEDYRQLVERRIALIESDPNIRLIEQPEYKRRWNTEPWESQLERALHDWLLDRLESYFDFDGRMNDAGKPTARLDIALTTVGRLADIARQDQDFLQVGELYRDDPAFDVTRLVAELVEGESVPLLPILRYKPSGLRKREEWENTWMLQRQEDLLSYQQSALSDQLRDAKDDAEKATIRTRIETLTAESRKLTASIAVPPKYTSTDFLKGDFWRLRGKLDVPKERWVSFPHCQAEDGTLMVAWAGYDHLQLARAISAYYVDVQERLGGRDDPRLVSLLACLIEFLPWLKQWYNEVDPEFGVPMGDYFEGFLQEESRNLGLTLEEIRGWEPVRKSPARRRRGSS